MRSACFLVPGRLDAATGGCVYDRRIVEGLRSVGWTIEVRELDDSFPEPCREALDRADAVFASLPDDSIAVVDGLAFGAMPDVVARHARRLRFVAVVHLPAACDLSFDADSRRRHERDERSALQRASLVVVTGRSSGQIVAGYGIEPGRIVLVEPGTDPAPIARGSGTNAVQMLCVATVNRLKGHDMLIRTLGRIRDVSWRLTCVGSLTREPRTVTELRCSIQACGVGERVELTGELSGADLDAQWDRADLFVLATRFETYGMAVAEALARGLPVVSTRTGSIPELVGDDGGLLVAPGDEESVGTVLGRAVRDTDLRHRLRDGARRARARLAPWPPAVQKFAVALMRVADGD